jgi:tetratricopeptide (TPR) repeat protein
MIGRISDSQNLIEQALALAEKIALDEPRVLVYVLHCQVFCFWALGNGEQALEKSQRTLEIVSTTGDAYYVAMGHFDLGLAFYRLGSYESACEHLTKTVNLCLEARYIPLALSVSEMLGRVNEALGDQQEAHRFFTQSRIAYAQYQGDWGLVNSLVSLGRVTYRMGQLGDAAGYLYEGLGITLERHLVDLTAAALAEFAPLLISAGQLLLARSVLQFLQTHPMVWPETQQRVEQYVRELPPVAEDDLPVIDKEVFSNLEEVIEAILAQRGTFIR